MWQTRILWRPKFDRSKNRACSFSRAFRMNRSFVFGAFFSRIQFNVSFRLCWAITSGWLMWSGGGGEGRDAWLLGRWSALQSLSAVPSSHTSPPPPLPLYPLPPPPLDFHSTPYCFAVASNAVCLICSIFESKDSVQLKCRLVMLPLGGKNSLFFASEVIDAIFLVVSFFIRIRIIYLIHYLFNIL